MSSGESDRSRLGWAFGAVLMIGLVVLIHLSVGWGVLLAPWMEIRPGALGAALGLVLASYAVRTIRIQEYFKPVTAGRFFRTFRLVLVHNLLNNLLPMRSGEASFPVLMAKVFQVSFSRSLPALFYLRVLDLHFVVLLGTGFFFWGRIDLAWALVLLLAPAPYGLFRAQRWLDGRLSTREGRMATLGREAIQGLPSSSGLFWRIWFWTGLNWSSKLLVLAWILQAFTPMPFPTALVGSTTGELSSVLPFHGIAGAGTYEAGVMAGLVPLGVDLEAAFKAAVNLHLFILGVSILAGSLAAFFPFAKEGVDERADDS
jgi:hypothetical protein